jgi:hypothetical protein
VGKAMTNASLACTQLQSPGAGLPFLELHFVRAAFRMIRWLTSRQRTRRRFKDEGQRILCLARSLDPVAAARPVLIRRVWGIEDSSRNWSVFMTLDHLVITNDAIAAILEHITAGKEFGTEVRIADVKPRPDTGPEVLARFAGCVESFLARTAALPDLRAGVRHVHPWFGPLDGHGWHCLAGLHMTIHRRQIQSILQTP